MRNEEYRATLTPSIRILYDRKQKDNALKVRLQDAVDLASAYLEDGAPYSALRVLREAVEAESSAQKESETK